MGVRDVAVGRQSGRTTGTRTQLGECLSVVASSVAGMGKTAHDGLTVRDHMMLDLEQSWWLYPGRKDTVISQTFSMPATRYYVTLNALINRPEAEAAYPLPVRRLRRLREERRKHRSSRRLG